MPRIPITPPNRSTDELAPGVGGVELIDGYVDPLPDGQNALFRRGGLWSWWWSGLQDPVDGLFWWEEKQYLLISCGGRVFYMSDMVTPPTEITSPTCRINFGSATIFASSGAWLCITSKNSRPIIWNGSGYAQYLEWYADDLQDVPVGQRVQIPACDSVCFTNDNFMLDESGSNRVRLALAIVNQEGITPGMRLGQYFSPDSTPDRLVKVDAKFGEIMVMGTRTVEFWAYDGTKDVGQTPVSRTSGAYLEHGIAAPDSLCFFNNGHIWLDYHKRVIRLIGRQPQIISQGFDRVIRAMTRVDDAKGFMVDNRFYCLSFPTDDYTLVYDFVTEGWYKWSYWVPPNYERFLGNCSVWVPEWNTQFIGSRKDGRVFIYHRNLVTDAFQPIRLMYRTAHLDWGTLDWKQSERLIMRLRRGM